MDGRGDRREMGRKTVWVNLVGRHHAEDLSEARMGGKGTLRRRIPCKIIIQVSVIVKLRMHD